jgi:hypothetical protein
MTEGRPVSADMPSPGAPGTEQKAVRLFGPKFRGMSEAWEHFETAARLGAIQDEFGAWLSDSFLFVHFITITLRDRRDMTGGKIPAGRCTLNAAWREFHRAAQVANGKAAPAGVRVVEYQRRGVPHIHALTCNTVPLLSREHQLENHLWYKFGKCQVLRFVPNLGASDYLCKYISKDARVEITAFGRLWHYARPGAGIAGPPFNSTSVQVKTAPMTGLDNRA